MKRILTEPLVHFLVLGALLFAAYSLLNRAGEPALGRIVIAQGQLASMRENFIRTRQRPPTPDEWEGLIRARVREEVYYREALALGLDRDDSIIRRRLQQKMEFISADIAVQTPPTDTELAAYFQAHPDAFRVAEQFTFRQLYLNPEQRGENLARDVKQLLAQLNQPGGDQDLAALGDTLMLGRSLTALSLDEVARQFGGEVAARLGGLPLGRWEGPVESSFGVHLIQVSARTPAHLPAFADVSAAVRREWEEARRLEANEKFYQGLLQHYAVTIESPDPVAAPHKRLEARR